MPRLSDPPTPSASPLSREEIARIEVGHTSVSPAVALLLATLFVAAIAAAATVELVRLGGQDGSSPWRHLGALPGTVPASAVEADGGAWARVVAANRTTLSALAAFERDLERQSVIGRALRPPVQLLLSGWLGAGNERVYVGREGWLFYRPDVAYATGAAFLSPRQQAHRVRIASEWDDPPQPDPARALRQLKLDLDTRGITLVVMPTPLKPTVHPEHLAAAYAGFDAPVQNPSFQALVDALRRDGILVFDPAAVLIEARRETGRPQYLRTDTHWRPEAMQRAAAALGSFLGTQAALTPGSTHYTLEPASISQAGDVVQMLDLPDGQTRYPLERVEITRVLSTDGSPWQPARGAEVLLLGDSFSNIYALETMGWGNGAGFAEHLSVVLRRPLDRLVQNDNGAFATRAMLQRVAASDPGRLANTRVVIYQFAARELAQGDWRLLPLPTPGGQVFSMDEN